MMSTHIAPRSIATLVATMTATLLLAFVPCTAQTAPWSDPLQLCESAEASRFVRIVADRGGNVHLLWTEADPLSGHSSIVYSTWDGHSWSQPIPISSQVEGQAYVPSIGVDEQGIIHVVYSYNLFDYVANRMMGELYYTRAYVGGQPSSPASWSTPRPIGGGLIPHWSDLAIDAEGVVHVVWGGSADISDDYETFYIHSTDSGETWTDAEQLASTDAPSERQRIIVDQQANGSCLL